MKSTANNLNPAPLTPEVYADIKSFIFSNIDIFRDDAKEYGGMDLTVACNEIGDQWNYQTGDNSYTGGAYGLQHWAVTTIDVESDPLEVYEHLIDQLEDLIGQ